MKRLRIAVILTTIIIVSVVLYSAFQGQTDRAAPSDKAACTNDCNVLLISVDSLRADHLGAYGYKRNTSPNLDKLASQGVLFTNYFSVSHTTPVSEMTVQTGLYPTSNGLNNFDSTLPKDRTILPQYLKKLGFHTQAIISSPEFLVFSSLNESFSRGYDEYPKNIPTQDDIQNGRQYPFIEDVSTAIDNQQMDNKQNFLWLAVGGVHYPYGINAKDEFTDPNYTGAFRFETTLDYGLFRRVYNGVLYPYNKQLTDADKQYVIDMYDNGVKAFDDYLGQVVQLLKDKGQYDKTIIVIESEHGEDLGEHGYFMHYDVLDTQTHVPLIIIDPRLKGQGKTLSSLTGSVDVLHHTRVIRQSTHQGALF